MRGGRRKEEGGRRKEEGWRTLRCAVCLLVCLSVAASPGLLCSPVLSCAQLSGAVPCRARVSAYLVYHCHFRLCVRVSLLVCCGRYVCCSKLLAFHNGFMFSASRSCLKHCPRLQAPECSLKSGRVPQTATRSKNMKPLWKVKGFFDHTSWNVSVPDCVFSEEMSKKE